MVQSLTVSGKRTWEVERCIVSWLLTYSHIVFWASFFNWVVPRTGYTARAWQSLLLETVTKEAGRTAGFTGMVCYLRALRSSSMTVHDGPWKMKVALQVLWPTQTKISMKGIGCALSKIYFSFMLWRTEVQLEAGWSWPPHANSRHDGKMHGRGTYKYAGRQDWLRWPCFATLVWINLSKSKIEEGDILDSPACQPVGPVWACCVRQKETSTTESGKTTSDTARAWLPMRGTEIKLGLFRSTYDSTYDSTQLMMSFWCLFDVCLMSFENGTEMHWAFEKAQLM